MSHKEQEDAPMSDFQQERNAFLNNLKDKFAKKKVCIATHCREVKDAIDEDQKTYGTVNAVYFKIGPHEDTDIVVEVVLRHPSCAFNGALIQCNYISESLDMNVIDQFQEPLYSKLKLTRNKKSNDRLNDFQQIREAFLDRLSARFVGKVVCIHNYCDEIYNILEKGEKTYGEVKNFYFTIGHYADTDITVEMNLHHPSCSFNGVLIQCNYDSASLNMNVVR